MRFDSDGNVLEAKKSKMLDKVRQFLDSSSQCDKETLPEQPLPEQQMNKEIKLPDDFHKMNNIDELSDDLSSSDDEKGVEMSDMNVRKLGHVGSPADNDDVSVDNIDLLQVSSSSDIDDEDVNADKIGASAGKDDTNERKEMYYNEEEIVSLHEGKKSIEKPNKSKQRNKKARRLARKFAEVSSDPDLAKYWGQRYRLFSLFDDGVKLDKGRLYQRFILCMYIKGVCFFRVA